MTTPPAAVAAPGPERTAAGDAEPAVVERETIDPRFVADVKATFASYKEWGRVDDERRWAPALCRLPNAPRVTMSHADDGGHARKLYSLFAKDREGYVKLLGPNTKPAVGQVIAKESYLPELVEGAAAEPGDHSSGLVRTAVHDGKHYRATKMLGLYVMRRMPLQTPGTDDGWIYGTLTPDGEVTSAGRVASCMGCHASAKHGRLFGRNGE